MKPVLKVAGLSAAMLVFAACQKKEEAIPEPAKVNIEITSPRVSHVYKAGDSVHVKASVSYTSQMHGYIVRITDNQSGSDLAEFEGHVHGDKFTVEEVWIDTVTRNIVMKVEVAAIIDHDGNEAKADVTIQNQP